METKPTTLVGIYKVKGGLIGQLVRAVGGRRCGLRDVTHSPLWKKRAFKEFEQRMQDEFGLEVRLLHLNERNEAELSASEGREPCVLLAYSDGSFSMFLDSVELKAVGGRVESFEKLVRNRLDIYT